jgi:hypothetical protein
MSGLSEVYLSLLTTSAVGLVLAIAKLCFKSKCSDIEFCCLKIRRDTETEEKEMEFETTHKGGNNHSSNSSDKSGDDKV